MNSAICSIRKAQPEAKGEDRSSDTAKVLMQQSFALYFVEQFIALLGTLLQQVALNWFVHKIPSISAAMYFVNPPMGTALMALCSGLTWILLTVWSFRIREKLRAFARYVKARTAAVPAPESYLFSTWVKQTGHHCSN